MAGRSPLLVLGTRSFSVEIADVAAQSGFEVVGFVENMERARCETDLDGLPVHWVDEVADLSSTHCCVCGLATTFRSRFTDEMAAVGMPFATVVHPSAVVSPQSEIGEGSVVGAGVMVGARTTVGRHVLVNRGALVGHHTVVEDFVSIQPGANVAGECRIREATWVGMGATVIDRTTVGTRSLIGAGAVVTKDVGDHVQVMGVPARVVKEDFPGR